MTQRDNQGEGNREAARNFNRSSRAFVEEHDVDELAKAREALTDEERERLERAEAEGRARARGDSSVADKPGTAPGPAAATEPDVKQQAAERAAKH